MSSSTQDRDLRQIQLASLEALKELKRLCDKHGLKYYLVAGTLLGAVRHRGFIPWDDDVDVAMPRSDYNKLSKIAKKELREGFFYQTERTDKNSPFFFAKLGVINTPEVKMGDLSKPLWIITESISLSILFPVF